MIHFQHPVLPILAATVALVAYGRWRADLVAGLALLAAVLSGVVPAARAFAGFAEPPVAIIALLAVFAAAIRNSGVIEAVTGALRPVLRWDTARIAVLGTIGAALAAAVGSRPVLATVLPTAIGGIRQGRAQSLPILLPISLLTVLGGLVTAVGAVPNLLLAGLWPGFTLFSFAAIGLPVALAGLLTIAVAWRFLPHGKDAAGPAPAPVESYTSEVVVPPGSPLVGQTVHAIEARSEGAVTLKGIVREDFRRIEPRAEWVVEAGDVLVLACEPTVLQRLMERAGLSIVGAAAGALDPERVGVAEAIITPASDLVGRSPDEAGLRARQVSLLAIGRSSGQPLSARLRRTKLQAGDVLLLQGELAAMPATVAALGCLTLTERRLLLGRRRRALTPLAALAAALALAATGTLPLAPALLAGVLALLLLRGVTLEEMYAAVPWQTVVLAAALLPLSLACRDGGGAEALARLLAPAFALPAALPMVVLALALACAPLLGGVLTLLALAPVAAALSTDLGLRPEPVLAAVALGASCAFVTRAGSGFRLAGDGRSPQAWRLLLPLYAAVLLVGGGALLLQ